MAQSVSTTDTFSYTDLKLPPGAIRLLRILPDLSNEGSLRCELQVVADRHEYTAISYTWGPKIYGDNILINGKVYRPRRNLYDFLRVARTNHSGWIWIDAICINQDDAPEKSCQVQQMDRIYRNARSTICWLGEPTLGGPEVPIMTQGKENQISLVDLNPYVQRGLERGDLSLLKPKSGSVHVDVNPEADRDEVGIAIGSQKAETASSPWHLQHYFSNRTPQLWRISSSVPISILLEQIFHHPYWTRLWIIQEVLLSRDKVLWYTRFKVGWALITEAIQQMFFAADSALRLVRSVQTRNDLEAWLFAGPLGVLGFPLMEAIGYRSGQCEYAKQLGTNCLCPRAYSRFQVMVSQMLQVISPIKYTESKVTELREKIQRIQGFQRDQGIQDSRFFHLLSTKCISSADIGKDEAQDESNFAEVLRRYSKSGCENRRDGIYGLLALAGNPYNIVVDYECNIYDLLYSTCRSILRIDPNYAIEDPTIDLPGRIEVESKVLQIMINLRIGPLDLVFGDIHRRAIAILVTEDKDREAAHRDAKAKFTRTGVKGMHISILEGVCPLCDCPIHVRVSRDVSSKVLVLQCGGTDEHSGVQMHTLLSAHSMGGWYAPRAIFHQIKAQGGNQQVTAAAQNASTNSNAKSSFSSTISGIMNLHEVFASRPHLDRGRYDNSLLNQPAAGLPEPDKELKRFHKCLGSGEGRLRHTYSKRVVEALKLEEAAEKNLIECFTREGYKFA